MIISPHLPHDPVYKRFKAKIGNLAMEYLIRLYAYCEADKHGGNLGRIEDKWLETLCEWNGEEGVLAAALKEPIYDKPGFVTVIDGQYHVVGWNEKNLRLISSWENGAKGGRPPKSANTRRKPEITQNDSGFSDSNNPDSAAVDQLYSEITQSQSGFSREEKSREEKIREEESGGTSPTPPNACDRRLVPLSLEEVIKFGETCMPPVPRQRCVQFWAHYEGQAVIKNGNRLWVTSQGNIITNWKARLRGWAVNGDELEQKNSARESAAVSARLTAVERRLREIGDGNAETVVEKLRLQKERADLLQQQKGCVPNVKDK